MSSQKIPASMRERKRLRAHLELKSLDETGRFAGYASVFGVIDQQRDVMHRGAFSAGIRGREHEVKLLWQHQRDEPIGVISQLFEDARGLYVEGTLLLQVARAKEAMTLLKSGAIKGLSIGYSPLRYTVDDDTGIRHLHEVALWEISLVTFPANQAAGVTVVKSAGVGRQASGGREEENVPPLHMIAFYDALARARGVLEGEAYGSAH